MDTKSVKFGESASDCGPAAGCLYMCGMCPSCAFAPKPPGSTRCVWKVSDKFRRRFMVELLLRCRNTKVLESIQSVLGVTSWSLFAYARSRSPASPQDYPARSSTDRPPDGKPLGVDMNEIWGWFSSSPDWMKSRYLCRLFSLCDSELLRTVANLTSVLLVWQKRGFLQHNAHGRNTSQPDQDSDDDPEDPALMVVPGSSKSASGVSRYRDIVGCLPVDLAKRILGLLDEQTLRHCHKVCRHWQHLAQQTVEETKFRRLFQDQIKTMMKRYKGVNKVSPTYANIVDVPVPAEDGDEVDVHPGVQKVRPFEAAYAKIKTKTVQMEERNVYCGAYFTKVLLDNEDPHRVVDYRGGSFMATASKDRVVRLLHLGSDTKVVSVMKGHVGNIRAALLCEDRRLLVTASWDTSIRCWCLKTDRCVMMLYGHSGTVSCLDVHADRLVSGAKDGLVKVWSLQTGKVFPDFHFKHPSPVQCVRITMETVYSSCDRGLIKIWDMRKASLLTVIDAHRSSVRCLHMDQWHLLSGDTSGQVMAWSINCAAKLCLMTFSHPKEVKSLTLVYLRVVTGCADGKIRIFNFLTGDCLREITAETETGRLLSLHFHDNSILVNTTCSVKRYQFAKVFWDYTESAEGGRIHAEAPDGSTLEKSAAPLRKLPSAQAASPSHKIFLPTPTKGRAQTRERCEPAKQSVMESEKAASERMRRRGLHHPLTPDSILLRVNAIQKARCTDEASINMEGNSRLRDSWGPHTHPLQGDLKQPLQTSEVHPRRAKTCVPTPNRASSQNMTNAIKGRQICTAPDSTRRRRPCLSSKKTPPHSTDTPTSVATRVTERPRDPERVLTRALPHPERSVKSSSSLPRISPVSPFREHGGFRLLTLTQLEESWAKKDPLQDREHKLPKRDKRQEKTV